MRKKVRKHQGLKGSEVFLLEVSCNGEAPWPDVPKVSTCGWMHLRMNLKESVLAVEA